MNEKERKLELVEQASFLGTICDLYKDEDNNIYMTRLQIGEALQYKDSDSAIRRLHNRDTNKDRLDSFSTRVALTRVEGRRDVERDTVLYMERGIYEICRISRQAVANDFYDWIYDKAILIRKTGGAIDDKEMFVNMYCAGLDEGAKVIVKSFMTKVEEQQEAILKMQPMVDDWSAYSDAKGNITVANLAKSLNISGIGRNKMFGILRENKVLRENNEPYQRFVDSGYFEVITGIRNGFKYAQTVVTGKGMSYINKKMKEWGYA